MRQVVGSGDALHRLDDYCRDVVVDHAVRGAAIIARNEVYLEGLRREAIPSVRVPGYSAGGSGAAVKAVCDRKHLGALRYHASHA